MVYRKNKKLCDFLGWKVIKTESRGLKNPGIGGYVEKWCGIVFRLWKRKEFNKEISNERVPSNFK